MISFSGIDCGGKSTQIEKIEDYYKNKTKKRIKVIHSRVGYTPMLEFFKTLIRKDKKATKEEQELYREQIHANSKKRRMLLWLSIFDMAIYYGIYFRFVEMFGITIMADRYFYDSYIDLRMKYGEIDYESWKVWALCEKIYLKPKYSIIYVIPAEVSMYRSELKDEPWPEPIEVRKQRISEYMKEIDNNRWEKVIDATKSIEEVFEETMEYIKNEDIIYVKTRRFLRNK